MHTKQVSTGLLSENPTTKSDSETQRATESKVPNRVSQRSCGLDSKQVYHEKTSACLESKPHSSYVVGILAKKVNFHYTLLRLGFTDNRASADQLSARTSNLTLDCALVRPWPITEQKNLIYG